MPKSKINVTSNKLDQAPKTRAAGYGKVVDSMRDEMTEAMNEVNVPKILSNKSDQAPKTRAAGYEKNVLEPLQNEINKRMDMLFLNGAKFEVDGNKSIRDYLQKFLNDKGNEFIGNCILKIQPGDSLSFEIKREKVEYKGWRNSVGHPAFMGDFDNFIHNFYGKSENGPLKPGEVSTAIVVKKDVENPDLLHIHTEQLEFPGKGALLSQGIFFHNPNIEDEEFQRIVGNNANTDTKKLIKENINEEIEIEKNGEESSENANTKGGLRDKIKGWFK